MITPGYKSLNAIQIQITDILFTIYRPCPSIILSFEDFFYFFEKVLESINTIRAIQPQ